MRTREPVMQNADEEEWQSSTKIVRQVTIMLYKENYQSYNVCSVNSNVAIEKSIKFVKTYT